MIVNTLQGEEERNFEDLVVKQAQLSERSDEDNLNHAELIQYRLSINSLKYIEKDIIKKESFNSFMNNYLPFKKRRVSVQTPVSPANPNTENFLMRTQSLAFKIAE